MANPTALLICLSMTAGVVITIELALYTMSHVHCAPLLSIGGRLVPQAILGVRSILQPLELIMLMDRHWLGTLGNVMDLRLGTLESSSSRLWIP